MDNYDKKNKQSIYEYSRNLLGKSFRDISYKFEVNNNKKQSLFIEDSTDISIYANTSHKGGLGELVEEKFFYYKPDSDSRADFPEANLELKVTPYRKNMNGTISAKERVSISMINYFDIVRTPFYKSNAWGKIENILFIYYLWEENKDRLDYIIDYVYLYSPSDQDLAIIKNDYKYIKNKVKSGNAHKLSEGDTLYLGAVTKSSNSRVRVDQPYSEIPAKPRAYSLKSSYMTNPLRNRIQPKHQKHNDSLLTEGIVEDFEAYVINKINNYKGFNVIDLNKRFLGEKTINKGTFSRIAYEILNVRTKNADEFEKANIDVKSIRINRNNRIVESMSFPTFKVSELIEEDWEDSNVYKRFSETKYLFVVYRKIKDDYYLKGAMFWNMPIEDIDGPLHKEWLRAQNKFKEGVILTPGFNKAGSRITNNLPKLSNTEILHVRNHSSKSAYLINGIKYGNGVLSRDSDKLPNGDRISKQCFWLNNKYILKQISQFIHKA